MGSGVGVGDGFGLGEGVGLGLGVGDGFGLGEGVGFGFGDGDGAGDGDGDGEGEGDGDGDGDGDGEQLPPMSHVRVPPTANVGLPEALDRVDPRLVLPVVVMSTSRVFVPVPLSVKLLSAVLLPTSPSATDPLPLDTVSP